MNVRIKRRGGVFPSCVYTTHMDSDIVAGDAGLHHGLPKAPVGWHIHTVSSYREDKTFFPFLHLHWECFFFHPHSELPSTCILIAGTLAAGNKVSLLKWGHTHTTPPPDHKVIFALQLSSCLCVGWVHCGGELVIGLRSWLLLADKVSGRLLPQQVHEAGRSNKLLLLHVAKLPSYKSTHKTRAASPLATSIPSSFPPIPSPTIKSLRVDFAEEISGDVSSNEPRMFNDVTQDRDIVIHTWNTVSKWAMILRATDIVAMVTQGTTAYL